MPDITPLIGPIFSSLLANNRPLVTSAYKTEWALLGFIDLCAAVDFFLLALALYQYLIISFAPFASALISAAVFFAAAIVAAVIRKFIMLEQASQRKSAEEEIKERLHHLMATLFNEM